ncbi:MAG: nitroreductase family protein [Thermoguttaceae bacterium]|nr:nitroreductase family protein [Thermoguttaceae bacterium]
MNRRNAIAGLATVAAGMVVGSSDACADLIAPGDRRRPRGRRPVDLIVDVRQAQRFTDDPVPEEDVKRIVQAGLNAPSALNKQPWFFSVATDRELLREIDKAAKVDPNGRLSVGGSPLAIFGSCDGSTYGKYDLGVAIDRANVVANLLGYGCKSVATAAKAANEGFKDRLQIPEGFDIFVALLIGKEIEPSFDGVSGATTREPAEKKVVYVK